MSTDVETSNQPTLQEILDNIRLLGEDEKREVYNPLREALFPNILTSAALIADLNALHRRLKPWMESFNDIASKFLDNYLVWFCFLDVHSAESVAARSDGLLAAAFMNPAHQTYRDIRSAEFALPATNLFSPNEISITSQEVLSCKTVPGQIR